MGDYSKIEHFFGIVDGFGISFKRLIPGNGDLRCKMQCYEWSDGRLGCPYRTASIVQKSRKTEKYIWYSDYVTECFEMGEKNEPESYGFYDLQEAYHQLEPIGELNDEHCVQLLMEIIRSYNDLYHRNPERKIEIPVPDYIFFKKCVVEVLDKGKNRLPMSIIAELYREVGLFGKCIEINAMESRSRDEKEIIAEVQFRAVHGDRKPFVIENSEYYQNNLRLTKRYQCSASDC
jgi:hypothetical protein